jgi:SAM-dependent methyltransferase
VLVVGAGTGAEVELLARSRSQWRLTAVHPAAPMLDVARGKAAAGGYLERVVWHTGYVADLDAGPEAGFDAAVMILVAHSLPVEAKRDLLADVATRLRPGAPLVFADLVEAAEPGSALAAVRRAAPSTSDGPLCGPTRWSREHVADAASGRRSAARHAAGGGRSGVARTFFRALGYCGAVSLVGNGRCVNVCFTPTGARVASTSVDRPRVSGSNARMYRSVASATE